VKRKIVIVGAGGHGSVLAEAMLSRSIEVFGFSDRNAALWGTRVSGVEVLGDDAEVLAPGATDEFVLVNGIAGANGGPGRERLQLRLEKIGWQFVGVVHSSAILSSMAIYAGDLQACARSVVQPGATIERGCIVNTAAIVEHGCHLAAFVHVATGAVLCGDVHVGPRSHVGAGAVVRQGIRLGPDTIVGAGAVVTRDFAGSGVLVGVPARRVA
jgi:sugar O-acyltransferase (sialic acid O-acetyltransferase NeuD family)